MIHLRVVSPPDLTDILMPVLHAEPAVMNLTVLPGSVSNPDGDAVHFDVLHGAANEIIGCLRDLGIVGRGVLLDVPRWAATATMTPPPAPPLASNSPCTCWPSTR